MGVFVIALLLVSFIVALECLSFVAWANINLMVLAAKVVDLLEACFEIEQSINIVARVSEKLVRVMADVMIFDLMIVLLVLTLVESFETIVVVFVAVAVGGIEIKAMLIVAKRSHVVEKVVEFRDTTFLRLLVVMVVVEFEVVGVVVEEVVVAVVLRAVELDMIVGIVCLVVEDFVVIAVVVVVVGAVVAVSMIDVAVMALTIVTVTILVEAVVAVVILMISLNSLEVAHLMLLVIENRVALVLLKGLVVILLMERLLVTRAVSTAVGVLRMLSPWMVSIGAMLVELLETLLLAKGSFIGLVNANVLFLVTISNFMALTAESVALVTVAMAVVVTSMTSLLMETWLLVQILAVDVAMLGSFITLMLISGGFTGV